MKFPKRIKHRGRVLATIYGKSKGRDSYRVAWHVAGRRRMASFPTYGGEKGAKQYADNLVKDLAKGSQVTALHPAQARDALAAFERLQSHFQATGRRFSLLSGISVFCEADAKLDGRTVTDAIDGFLTTVASVKRKGISEAVADFLKADAPRTKSADGERAQLSAKYAYNRKIQLEKFASVFPNTAICDLSKGHLDKFIESLGELKTKSRNKRKAVSAKSRNHYRASIRQFLQWAVRKDYLPTTHRLFEADAMRPERANNAAVEFYAPDELAALLSATSDELRPLRPLIAIGGLAGLRTAELLRLDWKDVWRVAGHIEITAGKAKTRQRRLVEICPALAAWLEPYHVHESGKLWKEHEITFQQKFGELCDFAKVTRKHNGLRHAYCSYHFALHSNENLTAAQAGNSPAMIHAHYKGLATKAEAAKWFNVLPPDSAKNVIPLKAL